MTIFGISVFLAVTTVLVLSTCAFNVVAIVQLRKICGNVPWIFKGLYKCDSASVSDFDLLGAMLTVEAITIVIITCMFSFVLNVIKMIVNTLAYIFKI